MTLRRASFALIPLGFRAKDGGVDGYRPHMSLLAGQVHYLSATTPLKVGKPPWCCPRHAEIWRLCCTSWCAAYWISECAEVRNECAS